MVKKTISDLAIFGGAPAFQEPLHVGRPNVSNRRDFLRRVNDALDRRWLTNHGPFLQEFESQMAALLGVRHFIAMSSGTTALCIALRALNLTGEVILPAFTFIATAHAVKWEGLTPIFCDIDPLTYNLDPKKVLRLISPSTSAILGVHVWGRPCDHTTLAEVATQHQLALFFDAAHAFRCSSKQRMIGNLGNLEIFSFHATKYFHTLEGGGVTTNDDQLAERIRLMQNFGFAGMDQVVEIGINGKMNEISAAMGLTGIESLEDTISINYQNYRHYREEFADLPGVAIMTYDEGEFNNFQYIVAEIDAELTGIPRDDLIKLLHAENILARRYFYPGCHKMEPYRSLYPDLKLPATDRLAQRTLCLPTGTTISYPKILTIAQLIRFIIENSQVIVARINQFKAPE